jgi:hypothetical protein
MKKSLKITEIVSILFVIFLAISFTACIDGGDNGDGLFNLDEFDENGDDSSVSRSLPVGTYTSNEHSIVLRSDGTFTLENHANDNDNRNFVIEGNYTYTKDVVDLVNDTYGKITFNVSYLELEAAQVDSLYLDDDEDSRSYTEISDVLEGW